MLGLTTEQNSTTFPTHEEASHNSERERERERERDLMLHFGPLGSLSNIYLPFE